MIKRILNKIAAVVADVVVELGRYGTTCWRGVCASRGAAAVRRKIVLCCGWWLHLWLLWRLLLLLHPWVVPLVLEGTCARDCP